MGQVQTPTAYTRTTVTRDVLFLRPIKNFETLTNLSVSMIGR